MLTIKTFHYKLVPSIQTIPTIARVTEEQLVQKIQQFSSLLAPNTSELIDLYTNHWGEASTYAYKAAMRQLMDCWYAILDCEFFPSAKKHEIAKLLICHANQSTNEFHKIILATLTRVYAFAHFSMSNQLNPSEAIDIESLRAYYHRHFGFAGNLHHEDLMRLYQLVCSLFIQFVDPSVSNDRKYSLILKINDGVSQCSDGFKLRLEESFIFYELASNIPDLFFRMRREIVEQAARDILEDDDVHTLSRFFKLAHDLGYGVLPIGEDIYAARIEDDRIVNILVDSFRDKSDLFYSIRQLATHIRSDLHVLGYTGYNELGYNGSAARKFYDYVNHLLMIDTKIPFREYFIINEKDELNPLVLDLNWPYIYQRLIAWLHHEKGIEYSAPEDATMTELLYNSTWNFSEWQRQFEAISEDIFARYFNCVRALRFAITLDIKKANTILARWYALSLDVTKRIEVFEDLNTLVAAAKTPVSLSLLSQLSLTEQIEFFSRPTSKAYPIFLLLAFEPKLFKQILDTFVLSISEQERSWAYQKLLSNSSSLTHIAYLATDCTLDCLKMMRYLSVEQQKRLLTYVYSDTGMNFLHTIIEKKIEPNLFFEVLKHLSDEHLQEKISQQTLERIFYHEDKVHKKNVHEFALITNPAYEDVLFEFQPIIKLNTVIKPQRIFPVIEKLPDYYLKIITRLVSYIEKDYQLLELFTKEDKAWEIFIHRCLLDSSCMSFMIAQIKTWENEEAVSQFLRIGCKRDLFTVTIQHIDSVELPDFALYLFSTLMHSLSLNQQKALLNNRPSILLDMITKKNMMLLLETLLHRFANDFVHQHVLVPLLSYRNIRSYDALMQAAEFHPEYVSSILNYYSMLDLKLGSALLQMSFVTESTQKQTLLDIILGKTIENRVMYRSAAEALLLSLSNLAKLSKLCALSDELINTIVCKSRKFQIDLFTIIFVEDLNTHEISQRIHRLLDELITKNQGQECFSTLEASTQSSDSMSNKTFKRGFFQESDENSLPKRVKTSNSSLSPNA